MTARFAVFLLLLLIAGGGFLAVRYAERHYPEHLPWTPLDLDDPIGTFTGRKLSALGEKPLRCRQLLTDAHIDYRPLPKRTEGPHCGYSNAVRVSFGEEPFIGYEPSSLVLSCPLAATLILWERAVVQPAASRHLGAPVAKIRHFGTYACRRVYGGSGGRWSEHASANAIDIGRFDLADGNRISVATHWERGAAAERAFLKEVRDGGCQLFATVLSPEYNKAHQDHFHLDQASRGAAGGRMCR
jgi:hypothetical protein